MAGQAGDIKRADAGVICLVRWRGGHFSSRHLLAAGSVAGDASRFFFFLMADGKTACTPMGGNQLASLHQRGWAIKLRVCVLKYETILATATAYIYAS